MHSVFHPPLWVPASDDYCGCYCRNRLSWLHPSQMRFAVFDSPALIRGRCPGCIQFSIPPLWVVGFRRPLRLLLSESPLWLHPSQMRFSVFDSPALIRGRCQGCIQFSIPPLWVVGSDDHCGCYCWNRPYGFIFRKCALPFLIHCRSFDLRIPAAFTFNPSHLEHCQFRTDCHGCSWRNRSSAFIFANALCCF